MYNEFFFIYVETSCNDSSLTKNPAFYEKSHVHMKFEQCHIGFVKILYRNYISDKNCMHKAINVIFCIDIQLIFLHLCCNKL